MPNASGVWPMMSARVRPYIAQKPSLTKATRGPAASTAGVRMAIPCTGTRMALPRRRSCSEARRCSESLRCSEAASAGALVVQAVRKEVEGSSDIRQYSSTSSRIRGPDRHLRHEAAVVHLQHRYDGLGDVGADELARVELAARMELRLHLARVDLHHPHVRLAQLCAPALRHPVQRELAGDVCRPVGEA